jgi:Zn-dependent protease
MNLLNILWVIPVVVIHELGHVISAIYFKKQIKEICFFNYKKKPLFNFYIKNTRISLGYMIFGGYCNIIFPIKNKSYAITAIAGVAANAAFAYIFYLFFGFNVFVAITIAKCCINLLPIPGTDGYELIEFLTTKKYILILSKPTPSVNLYVIINYKGWKLHHSIHNATKLNIITVYYFFYRFKMASNKRKTKFFTYKKTYGKLGIATITT